jgi:hypothetical protein
MRIRQTPSKRPATLSILALVLLSTGVASCDGEFLTLLEANAQRPGQVTVSPVEASASVGETQQFEVQVRDRFGNVLTDVEVTWASRAPGVASVQEGGLTEALAQGTATIEARAGGVTGSATITVRERREEEDSRKPDTVEDLRISGATLTSVHLAFTEVSDGTGKPAWYRVGYAPTATSLSWPDDFMMVREGSCAKPVEGTEVGSSFTCEVPRLSPDTDYTFKLIAYRDDGNESRVFGEPSNRVRESTGEDNASGIPSTVRDLRTTGSGSRSIELAFTEVGDGTGKPAYYRVRYAPSASNPSWPDDYNTITNGACANPVEGTGVGSKFSCEVGGLASGTDYDFGVIAYRYDDSGSRVFGEPSNVATGTTEPPSVGGIWIGRSELAALPTSGSAWDNLKSRADGSCPRFRLSDQDNNNNTCTMAKALVYARTGDPVYRVAVVDALTSLATMGTYDGRALALGRNLGAYAIAADLVDLPSLDSSLDRALRRKFRELLTTPTYGAASNLVDCHERRPNNWGTHCGGARAAVAMYLGDTEELERTAQVFRGFLALLCRALTAPQLISDLTGTNYSRKFLSSNALYII